MLNIAIDGPCGAGKSTVAKALARKLGILHLDTGALYRTIAWKLMCLGIDVDDQAAIEEALTTIDILLEATESEFSVRLDGKDVSKEIRSPEVSRISTCLAALPCVRAKLLGVQRKAALTWDVVLDGRDIGTCVLPNADNKFFLTATREIRAGRLMHDQIHNQKQVTFGAVMEDVTYRDKMDINREHSPLRQAKDAILIDTGVLTVDEVVDAIVKSLK